MVEYTCDSWGKLLSTTGSLATSLGNAQPFRYRGYVYDGDTGWYYLQSRYYDPNTGRFISSDVYLSTGQGGIGLVAGAVGGNGASYGNSKPIMQHGKDLVRRIGKKGFKKAVSYYAKVAHRQGGDFVLKALAQSMKYSAYGSAVSVIKTRYGNELKSLLF